MRIIVTAGPTREPLDDVRFLSNRSTGKLGYAIAGALARRHDVTLVSGPTALAAPARVRFVRFSGAMLRTPSKTRTASPTSPSGISSNSPARSRYCTTTSTSASVAACCCS